MEKGRIDYSHSLYRNMPIYPPFFHFLALWICIWEPEHVYLGVVCTAHVYICVMLRYYIHF